MADYDPSKHALAVNAARMGCSLDGCASDAEVVDRVLAHLRDTARERFEHARAAERAEALLAAPEHWLDRRGER